MQNSSRESVVTLLPNIILENSKGLFLWSINNHLIRHACPLEYQGPGFMRIAFFTLGKLVPNQNQSQKLPHICFPFLTPCLKSVYLVNFLRKINCTETSYRLSKSALSAIGEGMRIWLPVASCIQLCSLQLRDVFPISPEPFMVDCRLLSWTGSSHTHNLVRFHILHCRCSELVSHIDSALQYQAKIAIAQDINPWCPEW